MFHSKSCKKSVFLQLAALLKTACSTPPTHPQEGCCQGWYLVRTRSAVLQCICSAAQKWNIRSHWTVTSWIIFNKYMEINIIIFIALISLTGNLHLHFSESRARLFIIPGSLVALGSQSRIHPCVRASAKPKHHLSAICMDLHSVLLHLSSARWCGGEVL